MLNECFSLDYSLAYSDTCIADRDFVKVAYGMPRGLVGGPLQPVGAGGLGPCTLGLIRIMSIHYQGVWGVR